MTWKWRFISRYGLSIFQWNQPDSLDLLNEAVVVSNHLTVFKEVKQCCELVIPSEINHRKSKQAYL